MSSTLQFTPIRMPGDPAQAEALSHEISRAAGVPAPGKTMPGGGGGRAVTSSPARPDRALRRLSRLLSPGIRGRDVPRGSSVCLRNGGARR